MTDSQWLYYFSIELRRVAPTLSGVDALEVARAARIDGEPEEVARHVAASTAALQAEVALAAGMTDVRRPRRIRRLH